jgi:hypothetical protein
MPAEPKEPLAQPLIDYCEEHFDCELGPPMAFFELPQRESKDPVRVIYHVYAVQGPTYEACEAWLLENVFEPLQQRAGDEPRLYWRLEDKIQVEPLRDGVKVRTRLAVLKKLEQVYIAEMMTPEGAECPSTES